MRLPLAVSDDFGWLPSPAVGCRGCPTVEFAPAWSESLACVPAWPGVRKPLPPRDILLSENSQFCRSH